MNAMLGRVVYSKAGRDKGHVFVVVEVLDDDFVMIADGDMRKIKSPKKKRKKHLEYTEYVLEDIKRLIDDGRRVLDADIRKALKPFDINKK